MKKAILTLLPVCTLMASGCGISGDKALNLCVIYAVMALLSLLLAVGCICTVGRQNRWLNVLYCSVFVVNGGYFFLSIAKTLGFALFANRLSYLGSVFLPMAMLMILLQTLDIRYKKFLAPTLLGIGGAVFAITATQGWLPLYYEEVTLITENGVSSLHKVYGPLHVVYLIFLMGYFAVMTAVLIYSLSRRRIHSGIQATVVVISVFSNIVIWLMEQLVEIEFELLSVSYIFTEIFLLCLFLLMQEEGKRFAALREQVAQKEGSASTVTLEQYQALIALLPSLTPAERNIYELYVQGYHTKEVLAQLHITENTLKYHNKNIYSKLAVSSRKQLREIASFTPDSKEKF